MILKEISNFNNVNDYLPILNGCINADLIIIFLVYHGVIKSLFLKKWYSQFKLSAIIVDVLLFFIIIIITRFFYTYLFNTSSVFYFIGLAICVQIIHDLLFYNTFKNTPIGYNKMLDFFKGYSNEMGFKAMFTNIMVVTLACLFAAHFNTYSVNMNIVLLIVSCYFFPYVINYA
jgi:hypothetical protein